MVVLGTGGRSKTLALVGGRKEPTSADIFVTKEVDWEENSAAMELQDPFSGAWERSGRAPVHNESFGFL